MNKRIKRTDKRTKPSHRMTISFNNNLYRQVKKLQIKTKTKSYSREINKLVDAELKHNPEINIKAKRELISIFSDLISKVSQLNKNISGACNNLNQIAYVWNIKKYRDGNVKFNTVMNRDSYMIPHDIEIIQKDESRLKGLRKEVNRLWQILMSI